MSKRKEPVTSRHFPSPPSKKSRADALMPDTKYYAVRVGQKPGVYSNWADCQKQIVGFPNASFKSFFTKNEAADFVAGRHVASTPQSVRYYGVIAGSTSGVFTDWKIVEPLVKGSKAPKYKKFSTQVEAESFVNNGGVVVAEAQETPRKSKEQKPVVIEEPVVIEDKQIKTKQEKKEKPAAVPIRAAGASSAPTIVYSDGSALGNGKAGARAGVGVYFAPGDPRNVSERLKGLPQTNQRAELTAVLRTLQAIPNTEPVIIRTDSMYSINCITVWSQKWMTNSWRTATGEVRNRDLVEAIREIYDHRLKLGTVTKFEWVKGHSGHPGNEAADRLANQGALMPEAEDDGEL